MDLLNENNGKKSEKTTSQKIILLSIIILVFLLIITIALILLLPKMNNTNIQRKDKIKINNEDTEITQGFVFIDETGKEYLALKELSAFFNFQYYNGAYMEFNEDKSKCYIDDEYEIIGFEKDSNIIYKTVKGSNEPNYSYLELSENIILNDNKLYICVDDLAVALNLCVQNSSINSIKYLKDKYKKTLTEKGYTLDENNNNLKAVAYDMIVVSKNSKKGIMDTNFQEIVGAKYDTIEFNETKKIFIVSSNNKYGIIDKYGQTKINLIYDELKKISNSPLLFSIKKDGKIGLINSENKIILGTEYDKLGYEANKQNGIKYTLIISNVDSLENDAIVVSKDEKYGLIDAETGERIIPCETDGIYELEENNTSRYVVVISGQTYNLEDYLQYLEFRQNTM